MIYIDKSGVNGNVFAVLGIFKSYMKQAEKLGVDVTEHRKFINGVLHSGVKGNSRIDSVYSDLKRGLSEYGNMDYEGILETVTRLSSGYIQFTDGRKTKDVYL